MAVVVEMPRLSDTMREGSIVTWLKKEGDAIETGDVLAEVETDKAVMEYESEEDGVIAKYLVSEKEAVPIGTPICIISDEGEDISDAMDEAIELLKNLGDGEPEETAEAAPEPAPVEPEPAPVAKSTKVVPIKTESPAVVPAAKPSDGRVRKSPFAAKMAKENGLDLNQITGSGPDGRIIKRDIEQAMTQSTAAAPAAVPAPAPMPTGESFDTPASQMRRIIAERLVSSKNTVPHFYLTVGIDMAKAMQLRKDVNQAQQDVKVSVNDLILRAVALASTHVPTANASWVVDGKSAKIRQHRQVDVGVAVALEDGLVTPVLRDAGSKSVLEIASEIRDLAERARARKLGSEYYEGNTVTVSNLGMFGVDSFTAIVNPPGSIILAVGAVQKVPVVVEDELAVGTRMNVTLSCDHRVVDGALGAQWLAEFKDLMEKPLSLFF